MRFYVGRVLSITLATVVATGAIAIAAAAPKIERTPVPKPPTPDFSSMKFLLGTWSCRTQSSRRPAPFSSTTTNSIDPTGYWMIAKSFNPKTSWFPYTTRSTDMTTYDPDAHRWVDVFTADLGGYDVTTSPGWRGNTMTWTDALFTPTKDVLSVTPTINTKVSDTKITSYNTFTEGSGRTITVRTVCNKSS